METPKIEESKKKETNKSNKETESIQMEKINPEKEEKIDLPKEEGIIHF